VPADAAWRPWILWARRGSMKTLIDAHSDRMAIRGRAAHFCLDQVDHPADRRLRGSSQGQSGRRLAQSRAGFFHVLDSSENRLLLSTPLASVHRNVCPLEEFFGERSRQSPQRGKCPTFLLERDYNSTNQQFSNFRLVVAMPHHTFRQSSSRTSGIELTISRLRRWFELLDRDCPGC
jgi:hypothetical protein